MIRNKDLSKIFEYTKDVVMYFDSYKKLYFEGNEVSYLIEGLGLNTSMIKYSNYLSEILFNELKSEAGFRTFSHKILFKEFGISKIIFNINKFDNSIILNNDILQVNYLYDLSQDPNLDDIKLFFDHELHHIFINKMGNITNDEYFKVNNLISDFDGKTKAFLTLYYLSFKDEISSNINMFHREISKNKIKTKSDFVKFLERYQLYIVAIKMINFNFDEYWDEIKKEGNDHILEKELNINKLKISEKIINAGKTYKKKMSIIFIN